jgi:ABC-type sulfate transport system permease component
VEISEFRKHPGQAAVMLFIFLFLLLFFVIPVVQVIFVAFMDATTGEFTLLNFKDFFNTALFRESFWNSLYVGVMAVLIASAFSMPLAYFTSRFEFKGTVIIQSLGIIPLIMPPFVGAVAMLMLFGRNGSINMLLEKWFGINIPFMEGLNGVICPKCPLFSIYPDKSFGGVAEHRPDHGRIGPESWVFGHAAFPANRFAFGYARVCGRCFTGIPEGIR